VKRFLVDTNVPSELSRGKADPQVEEFLRSATRQSLHLSVMTIGEIRKGIAALPVGARRDSLEKWLARDVRPWFSGRILPVTEAIAERWGSLSGKAGQRGAMLPVVDGLIAATAIEHDLTVVTRNVKDFSSLGVDIFNPWES
jgi:predicted nucleic acid-binding protein